MIIMFIVSKSFLNVVYSMKVFQSCAERIILNR